MSAHNIGSRQCFLGGAGPERNSKSSMSHGPEAVAHRIRRASVEAVLAFKFLWRENRLRPSPGRFSSLLRMLDVLVDPVDDDVGDLQVVLVLHEHVAVALDAEVGQGDEGEVAARRR